MSGSKYHLNRAIIGPPAKRHLNGFLWRADNGPTLNAGLAALWFFWGSRTEWNVSLYFCEFSGGWGLDPLSPHWIRPCQRFLRGTRTVVMCRIVWIFTEAYAILYYMLDTSFSISEHFCPMDLDMGESSKFPKSWIFENRILRHAVCLQIWIISSLNGQLSLDKMKLNQRSHKNLPNSWFWGWLSL